MGALDQFIRKSFDRTVPGRNTKVENVPYTVLLGAPDERLIGETVNKYTRAGWLYVARKEEEGFFGIGACSKLTFQLPHETQPLKKAGRKRKGCLLTLVMILIGVMMGGLIVGAMAGQDGLLLGAAVGGFLGLLLGR